MAIRQRYYPGDEPKQVIWLTNYRDKIIIHGPSLGLTAGEITDIVADLNFYIFLLQTWHPALQNDVKEGTTYKKLVSEGTGPLEPLPAPSTFPSPPAPPARPPGVLTRVFNQVARIKKSGGYTEPIGTDLGVIGAEDATVHEFPEFTTKVEQGPTGQRVRLPFTKFGHKGVFIESRRGTGAWEMLGIDLESPYLDERPLLVAGQPETREYRMRWYDADGPNGEWSPVQKVTVGA